MSFKGIMVVDGDREIRFKADLMLKGFHEENKVSRYEVHADPDEALDRLILQRGEFDVLITDDYELVRKVEIEFPGIVCVIHSERDEYHLEVVQKGLKHLFCYRPCSMSLMLELAEAKLGAN